MKFNCGTGYVEKYARLQQWHYWFAWHPVWVGEQDRRWLETVWRKGYMCGGGDVIIFDYKAKGDDR